MTIHLAIDAIGAKYGGSVTGLIGILNAALADERIAKISMFCTPSEKRLASIPCSNKLVAIEKPWVDKNYLLRILWYEWLLAMECRRIRADVLLVSANFGNGCRDVPHVTYVRQSLPFSEEALNSFATYKDRLIAGSYGIRMKRSCRRAAHVICQSSVMKCSLIDTFGLDPARVTTIYSAPKQLGEKSDPKSFSETIGLPGNKVRLIYVGTDAPYKKLATVVGGLKLIQSRFPETELALTLPTGHHYASLHGIKCVGYLNDEQLAAAYLSAAILVLPSLVESGPQPPIEAMSLGVPVLIADRPYALDICEDAALFFDPLSPQDFADKAIVLLHDTELRQTLIKRGYALVEKRRDQKPHQKIIDICLDVALEAKRKRSQN